MRSLNIHLDEYSEDENRENKGKRIFKYIMVESFLDKEKTF